MRPSRILAALFGGLAVLSVAVAACIVLYALSGEEAGRATRLTVAITFGLAALIAAFAFAWWVIHSRLLDPLAALAREIETLTHTDQARAPTLPRGHLLGELPAAVIGLLEARAALRQEIAQAIETATARAQSDKQRLEAILVDLAEGVIVCNLEHRILLYNQAAMRLLGAPEALGLGCNVFDVLAREAVIPALAPLLADPRSAEPVAFSCQALGSGQRLDLRLGLVTEADGTASGYVLSFSGAAAGERAARPSGGRLPPRPEFYDFDLFRAEPARSLSETPLSQLRCVVFDTETTGLRPSEGDELISIGAVRVVNGRVLTGETFERLINPGRYIPQSSIRFHGITQEMVADKPPAAVVLRQFASFVGESVLVAYNAAFDMKFLHLKQAESGITFDQPVLDVLLLGAFLHDHAADQSLDAIAARLGITIKGRHTALGDALATAAVFVALIGPLKARGVETLGQALEVSSRMTELRSMQAEF